MYQYFREWHLFRHKRVDWETRDKLVKAVAALNEEQYRNRGCTDEWARTYFVQDWLTTRGTLRPPSIQTIGKYSHAGRVMVDFYESLVRCCLPDMSMRVLNGAHSSFALLEGRRIFDPPITFFNSDVAEHILWSMLEQPKAAA